nr:unnamed protein product [Digitaria exilis]
MGPHRPPPPQQPLPPPQQQPPPQQHSHALGIHARGLRAKARGLGLGLSAHAHGHASPANLRPPSRDGRSRQALQIRQKAEASHRLVSSADGEGDDGWNDHHHGLRMGQESRLAGSVR